LQWLSLQDNHIIYFPDFSEPNNLNYLDLSHNRIKHIFPLSSQVHLQQFMLDHNQIIDLSPLIAPNGLTSLDLRNNPLDPRTSCELIYLIKNNHPALTMHYDPYPSPLPGDGNRDCFVNLLDFNLLAALWLQTGCGDCDWTDFNNNQIIETADLAAFLDYYLRPARHTNLPPVVDAGPPQFFILHNGWLPPEFSLHGAVTDQTVFGANVLSWHWEEGTDFGTLLFYAQDGITLDNTDLNGIGRGSYETHTYKIILTASDGVYEANDFFILDARWWDWTGEISRYSFEPGPQPLTDPQYLKDTGSDSEIHDDLVALRYRGIDLDSQAPQYYRVDSYKEFEPNIVGLPGIEGLAIRFKDIEIPCDEHLYQPQPLRTGLMLQCPGSFETALHGFGLWTIEAYIKPDPGADSPQHLLYHTQIDTDKPNSNDYLWYIGIEPNPPRIGALFYQADGQPIDLRYRPDAQIPLDQWSHIACTGDGQIATLWVNGFDVCSAPYDGTIKINLDNKDGLRISSIFPEYSYQGLLDEIILSAEPRDADYMRAQALRIPIELVSPSDGFQHAVTDHPLRWKSGLGPFIYEYEVWLKQLPAGEWTMQTTTTDLEYRCSGLLPDTEYQWYIKPICDVIPAPTESEKWTFKTQPLAFDSLLAHWTFNEGAGSIVDDTATVLNRSGVDWNYFGKFIGSGDPNWIEDGVGPDPNFAAHFSGRPDNYVIIPKPDILVYPDCDPDIFEELPYDRYSISLWVNAGPGGFQNASAHFLSHGDSYGLSRAGATDYAPFYAAGIGDITGSTNINDGNWHHLVAVFDNINLEMSLYVDGALDAACQFSYLATHAIDWSDLLIGANLNHPNQTTNGTLDEVRIYTHNALTPTDIQNLFIRQPFIDLYQTTFYFDALADGDQPQDQTLKIRNDAAESLDWDISHTCPWLTINPDSGTCLPGEVTDITLQVDITNLPGGNYSCQFFITDTQAVYSHKIIDVNLYRMFQFAAIG